MKTSKRKRSAKAAAAVLASRALDETSVMTVAAIEPDLEATSTMPAVALAASESSPEPAAVDVVPADVSIEPEPIRSELDIAAEMLAEAYAAMADEPVVETVSEESVNSAGAEQVIEASAHIEDASAIAADEAVLSEYAVESGTQCAASLALPPEQGEGTINETSASSLQEAATAEAASIEISVEPIVESVVEAAVEAVAVEPEVASPAVAPVDSDPVVALPSNSTVKDAASLKAALIKVVQSPAVVALDVRSVERVDTATMQLLCAFVRERTQRQLGVKWLDCPKTFVDSSRILGIHAILGLPEAGAA